GSGPDSLNISGGSFLSQGPLLLSSGAAASLNITGTGLLNISGSGPAVSYIDVRYGGSVNMGGGSLQAESLRLTNSSASSFTQSNGIAMLTTSFLLGRCGFSANAHATVTGGALYVTNANHTAVLDVRDSALTLGPGAS